MAYLLEDIVEFIEILRSAGYEVNPLQCVTAESLLVKLVAQGIVPNDICDYKTLLAPILCSSPEQQRDFYWRFEQWVATAKQIELNNDVAGKTEKKQQQVYTTRLSRIFNSLRDRKYIILLICILAILASIAVYLSKVNIISGTVSFEDNRRVVDASVLLEMQRAGASLSTRTNDAGQFSIQIQSDNSATRLSVRYPDYETYIEELSYPLKSSYDIKLQKSRPIPIGSLAPVIPQVFIPKPNDMSQEYPWKIIVTCTIIVLILTCAPLALVAYSEQRQRLELHRLMATGSPEHITVTLGSKTQQIFQTGSFRRVASEMRRVTVQEARELNVISTICLTAQNGGLYTPVYKNRQVQPEFLVMISQLSYHDHQSRLHNEIIKHLAEYKVPVEQYYFQLSPRYCWTNKACVPIVTFKELMLQHSEKHLMIFSESANVFDAVSGEPEDWLKDFGPWCQRNILMPDLMDNEPYYKMALKHYNFDALPSSIENIIALTQAEIQVRRNSQLDDTRTGAYPPLLRQGSRRWIENASPQREVIDELSTQLKAFLSKEGFYWLCACSIYPELIWELTIHLGGKIMRESGALDCQLMALVRLPWFRYGRMPDWLRHHLISELLPSQEYEVRQILKALLADIRDGQLGKVRLAITLNTKNFETSGEKGYTSSLSIKLKRWLARLLSVDINKGEPPADPGHDRVFVNFITGDGYNKLAIETPVELNQYLLPNNQYTYKVKLDPSRAYGWRGSQPTLIEQSPIGSLIGLILGLITISFSS